MIETDDVFDEEPGVVSTDIVLGPIDLKEEAVEDSGCGDEDYDGHEHRSPVGMYQFLSCTFSDSSVIKHGLSPFSPILDGGAYGTQQK